MNSNDPDPEYMKLVRKMLANKLKEKLVIKKSTKNIQDTLQKNFAASMLKKKAPSRKDTQDVK